MAERTVRYTAYAINEQEEKVVMWYGANLDDLHAIVNGDMVNGRMAHISYKRIDYFRVSTLTSVITTLIER